jgi:DNA-binding IclR family transcriptional regulator
MSAAASRIGDEQVLDYIAAHNGTISLSQAAQDLSMSHDALRLTIERLKAAGLLQQT